MLDFQAANKASASLTDVILETHRKKHMAFLMADLGVLVDKESGKQITRDVRKKWRFFLSVLQSSGCKTKESRELIQNIVNQQ